MAIEIISTPARNLSLNNLSRWGAAFNPQVFLFQRKDFEVVEVIDYYGDGTSVMIVVPGTITEEEVTAIYSDKIRVKTNLYDFYAEIAELSNDFVNNKTKYRFNIPFVAGALLPGGFLNSTGLKPGYKIQITIAIDGEFIIAKYTPDIDGLCRADLQAYLKAFTSSNDSLDYNVFCAIDNDRFEQYTISIAEFFDRETQEGLLVPGIFYITHSALQFNKYGSNMAEYVTFLFEPNDNKRAKFLTTIKQPMFTSGYPMDLSFIFNDELEEKVVYCRYGTLDINKNVIAGIVSSELLINSLDSLLINDSDKLLIGNPGYEFRVGGTAGVWRLPIIDAITPDVAFIDIFLYYVAPATDTAPEQYILLTEGKRIAVNKGTCKTGVYVKWLNLLGGWDYQLFEYRAEYAIDVTQTYVDRLVLDYSTQNATQDVLSKTGVNKIKIGKEAASAEEMQGLAGMLTSPKVYMLLDKASPQEWQTVIVDAKSATLYDTKDWFGDFEVTIKLPALNIQTA